MKHIHTFESFLNEAKSGKWKAAYNGKGYYGVTNGGPIEGEMSKEDAEVEAEKRNQVSESFLNEAEELDVIEWDEFVKPDHLMLSLSNGKKLRIDRKYVAGGKNAYFQIIDMLENMDRNPKAKAFIKALVSKMASNLK